MNCSSIPDYTHTLDFFQIRRMYAGGEVPGEKCEAFTQKLLPLVGNVFSIYDLSDDNFALSPEYDLLYTELTGAVILYIEEYGV